MRKLREMKRQRRRGEAKLRGKTPRRNAFVPRLNQNPENSKPRLMG